MEALPVAAGAFIVARAATEGSWQIEQQTVTPRSIASGRRIERAKDIPAEHSRHMLELAATYERTADYLAPALATSEGATVFTRCEILRR